MSESTSITGRWRITEMDNWDQETIDLVQRTTFVPDSLAEVVVAQSRLDAWQLANVHQAAERGRIRQTCRS